MRTLAGKTALVTGATGVLGKAVAVALREYGVTVVATHRSGTADELIGISDLQVRCDLSDEGSVQECIAKVGADLGGLDIIVHTVGGFASDGTLEDTSLETWNSMFTMNLTSSFLVLREGLRIMSEKEYGRIILVSALSAFSGGPGAGAYRISKAGLGTLVEIAEAEKKGRGITINALAPRIIDTPRNRADMPDADPSAWVHPSALAATVVHLCSAAGGAISGDVIRFP